MSDEIKEKRKEKWFEVWFSIEALAVDKDVVENALKRHVEKMGDIRDIFVYETEFSDTIKVEKPMKNVEEAYSQIVKVKFFAKNLSTLIGVVMTYGPSSVEIIGPDKKEISVAETQDIVNLLAGVVHQFAAAGVGGIIITPDKPGSK
ncbi:MAG TPA: hypothetical protein VJH04_04595 [archaeon]|nr:hypothetical protein [archaeon]